SASLVDGLRRRAPRTLADLVAMRRGVLVPRGILADARRPGDVPYFGGDVYRHELCLAPDLWVPWDERVRERPHAFTWFEGERVVLRRLVNRQGRLMAAVVRATFVVSKNLYTLVPRGELDAWGLAALVNARLFSYLYTKQVPQAAKDDFPQVTIR